MGKISGIKNCIAGVFNGDVKDTKVPRKEDESEKEEFTLATRLTKLETNVAELTQLFREKIDRDEAKRELIKTVTTKLQQYEKDFIFEKFQKRVFLDIVQLFDRIEDVRKHANLPESEDFNVSLESFRTEILQILGRQGVRLIENPPKKFNTDFQEAIERKPTSNPEDDDVIIEVMNKGFMYQETVLLRPEMVVVEKYNGGE